jgi:hypothetical protein
MAVLYNVRAVLSVAMSRGATRHRNRLNFDCIARNFFWNLVSLKVAAIVFFGSFGDW